MFGKMVSFLSFESGVIMDITVIAFCLVFLVWFLMEFLKKRRDNPGTRREETTLLTKIFALSNPVIAVSYIGFCIHEICIFGALSIEASLSSIAWSLASVAAVHSLRRTQITCKRWPLVLVSWWCFSSIRDLLLVVFGLLNHFKSVKVPKFLPKSNIIDFATLPLSVLLFKAFLNNTSAKNFNDSTLPFLGEESEKSATFHDSGAFSCAGIWSHLTFKWLNPLFQKGHCGQLELEDIPEIPESDTADIASTLLEESLRNQRNHSASLPCAILHAIWRPLILNGVFAGVNTTASYIGPLLIPSFVNLISTKEEDINWQRGMVLALVFLIATTLESISQRQWYFGARRIGIRVKAALMVLIYKKSLSVKYGVTSNGKIINFINVDVERIGDFFWNFHGIWLLLVQVVFALVILYRNLGALPSTAALLTTTLVMVSNMPLANMQKNLHTKIMESKDSRLKATSEIVKSMRVLKLHSWEPTFLKKLLHLREAERSWLKRYLYTCSAVAFLFWASPTLVSVLTFGVCILFGTPLTSGTVLSALATFRILQEPIYNLPELISMIAQTKVSIDRIQNFVSEEDQKRLIHYHAPGVAIEIEAGEYAWENRDVNQPTIKITEKISIPRGCKVAICGSVGSGKTSFLCSILGEIPLVSGIRIKTYGSKAFVPQTPWIQTGTVRCNVLFGKEMNRHFYENVVEACALNHDIESWAGGDLSVVGERGMNLSGGQKQRIQMARALYSNSDTYLLDDPFSAVDAHTGAHMFKKCLMQLLCHKTVVYVTHQLEFLDAADLVLVMKDGRIVESGKYQDLISSHDGELIRQMAAHSHSLNQVSTSKCIGLGKSYCPDKQMEIAEEKFVDTSKSSQVLHEETETGRVKWQVYSTFVTSAFKGALVPIILLCQVLFQGLQMASNYWIAWGSEEEGRVTKERLIAIFALLSGGSSFFILGRAILLSTIAIETAQRLFLGMIGSIVKAPLSFFDSTPSSRILRRSSTDQSVVDTDIPYRLAGLAFALIQLLSIVFLMSHVAWQVFFLFVFVIALSIWYQIYYIKTARELSRMVPILQAPILQHISESISGAAVIRSFNQECRFMNKNMDIIDDYSRVSFHNAGTMEWLCVRINFLFNIVFFLLLVILVSLRRSSIDPRLGGLAASYGLNLSVIQSWVIWNFCNVENKMISVERILEFTSIPSEPPLVNENFRPPTGWPFRGKIQIENLHVHYSPVLPKVLKGITCTFPCEKKIGIVGRTGSGKSTLIQALFRMVEHTEGRILIDDIDISKIGLQDLRTRLSIIPQDPVLFQGTVRINLDPLQEHEDQGIWEVLYKCHLAEIVKQDQRLLDAPVAEDGENWSVGQRQLVCLARVLLQRRKILVLDEATSSVDTATDTLIQKTIREETNGSTVITLAHRIPTVVDNDLILVLGEGKVIEYDRPAKLLEDNSSAFSTLVMEFLRRSSTVNK